MTVWTNASLRTLEHESIRDFVEASAGRFSGRVLDYGCGRSPYRDVIESTGAEYFGFDRRSFPANVSGRDVSPGRLNDGEWDAILVTQILQYTTDPGRMLAHFFRLLKPGGFLVLTGATNWPVIENEDLMRLTTHGVDHYAKQAGFAKETLIARTPIEIGDIRLPIGYGYVGLRAAHLIYGLADPETGEIRYVGKTSQSPIRRLRQHVRNALTDQKQQRRLRHWIASLGAEPKLVILETGPEDVDKAERHWIGQLRNDGARLCNQTNGGDGRSRGYSISAEERERRTHRVISEQTRAKLSAASLGRRQTPEARARMSAAALARPCRVSDEVVLAIRGSNELGRVVARRYGVSESYVSMIRRGRSRSSVVA